MTESRSAKVRGELRKRRRKRAERRVATAQVREARNEKMRAEEHPGWATKRNVSWNTDRFA